MTTRVDPAAVRGAAVSVPGIPRDEQGLVFREPWEAQAFAAALALHQRGLFTWTEWAATRPTRSGARSKPAIRTPARRITVIGSRRWSASLRRRGSPMRSRCDVTAMRGTAPRSARLTARQ